MALYIVFSRETDETNRYQELQWHVGERLVIPDKKLDQVIEVQADGDELNVILTYSMDIPLAYTGPYAGVVKTTQRWFGDHAKFIVANILS